MLAILPLLVFLVLFALLALPPVPGSQAGDPERPGMLEDRQSLSPDWREAFLKAAIAWGALVVLLGEGLSLVRALTQTGLAIGWAILLLGCFFIGWRKGLFRKIRFDRPGRPQGAILQSLAQETGIGFGFNMERLFPPALRSLDGLFLLVTILFFAILALIAWLAPPNTNDSLAYHLSRVMHWIQNRGLQHYATPIPRQIWMPEWAELAMLQFHSLAGSDRLDNFVQWFSAVASVSLVSLAAKRLGAGFGGQVLAALFCATIPMGILQASSTQNDYVAAFWVAGLAYFALVAHQRRLSPAEWLWLSLCAGLGVLTKGTFYAFAVPFLGWLLVSALRRERLIATLKYVLLGLVVVLLLNGGMWRRNLQTYAFPLGPREFIQNLSNESWTPGAILSNVIRNTAIHFGTPYELANQRIMQAIRWIHRQMNQELLDPATTLKANEFRLRFTLHEDFAGNPVHLIFLLSAAALVPFALPKQGGLRNLGLLYGTLVLSTFLLFSALYKWQAFTTRLQLPFFVSAAPLVGLISGRLRGAPARAAMAGILALSGIFYLLLNPSRPLVALSVDEPSLFTASRADLLFVNFPEVTRGYVRATNAARTMPCRSIGLVIDSSDPEYPFWALLSPSGREVRLEHMDVSPPLDRYAPADFKPCLIICTTCTGDVWGEYQRITHLHGAVRLYVPPEEAP